MFSPVTLSINSNFLKPLDPKKVEVKKSSNFKKLQ